MQASVNAPVALGPDVAAVSQVNIVPRLSAPRKTSKSCGGETTQGQMRAPANLRHSRGRGLLARSWAAKSGPPETTRTRRWQVYSRRTNNELRSSKDRMPRTLRNDSNEVQQEAGNEDSC